MLIPLPKSVSIHYQYIKIYITLVYTLIHIHFYNPRLYKWIMKATWIAKKIDDDRFYGICGGFAHEGQYVF